MEHLTNCFGGAGAFSGGTNWMKSEGITLRRCTRRYSSQRDEFYHAKQIREIISPDSRTT